MFIIDNLALIEIIKKAQAGDKKSLEIILNMYKPLIIKNITRIYICGCDMEDLFQISSIALIKAVHKYDCSKKIPFLFYVRIAIQNALKGELRKVTNKKNEGSFKSSLNSITEEGVEIIECLVSDENVEEAAILKEEVAVLRAELKKLSPKEKEILDWVYFKEKTLTEYAKIKGLKINTAVKRKERAVGKLRKSFLKFKV